MFMFATAVWCAMVVATVGALVWALVLGMRRPDLRRWSAVLGLAALTYPWGMATSFIVSHALLLTSHPLIHRPVGMPRGMWVATVGYLVQPLKALPLLAALAYGLHLLRVPPSASSRATVATMPPSGAAEPTAGPHAVPGVL